MARVLKDSMMRFAIEITRSPKWVQCVIRDGNEVAFKRMPLNKTITDAYYHTDEGAYLFDQRWEEVLYPDVPQGNERGKVALADLTKVIDSFLNGGLPVTDKAERMLRALRIDPTAVEPLPSAEQETDPSQSNSEINEDNTMSKKTKVKKAPKAKAERKEKFAPDAKIILIADKKFNEGSTRGKCFSIIQKNKTMTVAEYLKACSGREINKAQAISCLSKLIEPKQKLQTVKLG